jgi:ADP-dependent NAD(P)H-hydrate dehydratase / NAD(P)H-hydrate epimerase
MRLATVSQSLEIDRLSQEKYLLSPEVLMEAAGALAAREISQSFLPELAKGHIGLLCGPGHNGGDGLVVARHLYSSGFRDLIVFLGADPQQGSDLFRLQLSRIQKQGLLIVDLLKEPQRLEQMRSCSLLVDALFGVGLNRPLADGPLKWVEMMNSCNSPIVSLDVPSGLDADRGLVLGHAVQAAMTVTFGLAKPGFFSGEGPRCVGKLRISPIGFPFELLRKVATTHFAFNERLARRYLPKRPVVSHKGDHGHLVVVAGAPGTWGAALLAATSAYRVGAGYVTLASFENSLDVVRQAPEILTTDAHHLESWLESKSTKKVKAFAVGPGLGVSDQTADLIRLLKKRGEVNVVLDADAITVCARYHLFPLPASWVLTPHAAELGRVLGVDVSQINSDRFQFAVQGAQKVGCHVLLKGYRSLLASERRCMVILAGNSALAKAGSGDVLTGMIGGLMAQGISPVQATATAAYLHGRVADEWIRSGKDRNSLLPSDIGEHLPSIMDRLRRGALF